MLFRSHIIVPENVPKSGCLRIVRWCWWFVTDSLMGITKRPVDTSYSIPASRRRLFRLIVHGLWGLARLGLHALLAMDEFNFRLMRDERIEATAGLAAGAVGSWRLCR